jgi:RimJ/RimL family protein N-acetyltransferase
MKIQRFVIGCAVNNQRSRSVAERLGYRLHATQPKGEVVGEFIYDRVIYGIRSTDWRERNKANVPSL